MMTEMAQMTASLDLAGLQRSEASADAVARRATGGSTDNIDAVAREFEAMVLGQMLAPMMNTVPTDGPFSGGPGGEAFRSMMVDEIGNEVAEAGGIGIADMVRRELLALQEA